jgi:hypothetical protein
LRRSILRGAALLTGVGTLEATPPPVEEPRATGRPVQPVKLTGKLFPWEASAPVFVAVPGIARLYLPCFVEAPALRAAMQRLGISYSSIKHIDDGRAFLESLPRVIDGRDVCVILDPHLLPNGRVRWLEVKWD